MVNGLKKPLIILSLIGTAVLILSTLKFSSTQLLATAVFLVIICGTLFYWKYRLGFALGGVSVLLAADLLDVPHIIEFAGIDIIIFLMGMMTIVGYLEEKRFFEHLINAAEKKIGNHPHVMIGGLMVFSAVLAALVDEVTSILIVTTSLFHLVKRYKLNPIPFLLIAVFATNIGSSATAVGNPIGIIIALRANLGFSDFFRWATPITIVTLAVAIPLCFWLFRSSIKALKTQMIAHKELVYQTDHFKMSQRDLRICWMLFIGVGAFLVGHTQLELLLGLKKNTMLIGTALGGAAIAVGLSGSKARTYFMRHVDWWTLSFFMLLFTSVGTLEYVGVTELISNWILHTGGDNQTVIFFVFSGFISVLTAFMDNVLAVATFIPILGEIQDIGVDVFPMWWGMLFSGTLFGNITVIGSTANIVAMGQLEREFDQHIGFMEWFKPGAIISVVTLAIALFLLYIQFPLMP